MCRETAVHSLGIGTDSFVAVVVGAVIQPLVLAVLRGYRRVIEYRTVFLVISLALDVFA